MRVGVGAHFLREAFSSASVAAYVQNVCLWAPNNIWPKTWYKIIIIVY